MQIRFVALLFACLFAGLFALTNDYSAKAATTLPTKMNFQGRITNSAGSILANGTYNMRFRIFNAATAGTQQWSENRLVSAGQGVTVTNGQFSVQLGDVTSLPASVFTSNSLYFEVELPTPASATGSSPVWTEGAMTPRNQLATSAYAFNSETLDGLDSAAFGQLDQNNTFTGNNTFSGTLQGGSSLTLGTAAAQGSLVLNDGNGQTGTLRMADTAGNYTYTIPVTTTNDTFCLQALANCTGSTISVGSLNGGTANANGATLAGSILYLQSASASFAGLVDTTTQTFAGNKTFNGTLTVGTSTNGVTLTSTGYTLAGTARSSKRITLAAEYANSVLDAGTGTNNSGSMTAGLDLTNRMNYYKWTTTQGTNQSYDVAIQIPIPSDFSAWASTTPINVTTRTSNISTGTVTIEARDTGGTVVSGINFASITPTSTGVWQIRSAGTISGTYTAGEYMTLRIRLQSPTGGDVRVGNITMDYLSKW